MQNNGIHPSNGCPGTTAASSSRTQGKRARRGGALLTALVLMTAVSIVVAHVLRTTTQEARLTHSSTTRIQADNTSELLVDYALGELAKRFGEEVSFADDEFSPDKNPLVIRNEVKGDLAKMNVDVDSLALFGGPVSTMTRYYVNPDDPANRFDPLKRKFVFVRHVDFYARATTSTSNLGQTTSYAKMTVQLRDAPLTSNAIFYNMDLEFHPGPSMVIDGPVHANGNIWLMSQGKLQFEDVVTCTGELRVGFMLNGYHDDWGPFGTVWNGTGVEFRNDAGNWQGLYRGSGSVTKSSSYYISTSTDFSDLGYESWREYATNEFGGNVQSGAHGVTTATPSGVQPYVPSYSGSEEKENHGYVLIEPNLPLSSPYHKGEAEDAKMARKAGIIIRVHRDLDGDGVDDDRGIALPANAVRLRSRPDQDDGWSCAARDFYEYYLARSGLPDSNGNITLCFGGIEITVSLPAVQPYLDLGAVIGTCDPPPPPPTDYNSDYYISFTNIRRSVSNDPNSDPVVTTSNHTVTNSDGDTRVVTYSAVSEDAVNLSDEFDFTQTDYTSDADYITEGDRLRAMFDEAFAVIPTYLDSSGNISGGMTDRRVAMTSGEISNLSIIDINLAALANILEDGESPMFGNYLPKNGYNGIVYVEFPIDPAATPRTKDKILRSVEGMGLMLTEAGGPDPQLGRIPAPAYNNAPGRDPGFTLVTNQAVYVRGHFNADGDLTTPTQGSVFGADTSAGESPAMIMGDAVTILSDAWKIANSDTNAPRAVANEFSGAIVAGILPTNEGGRSVMSGGNHNFMRFLEDWDGLTYRYKGSMICAYESEIQNEMAYNDYYNPPIRQWGYNRSFAKGNFPPGTPVYQTFRKIAFEYLNAQEFNAAIDSIPWNVTLP